MSAFQELGGSTLEAIRISSKVCAEGFEFPVVDILGLLLWSVPDQTNHKESM